jgi:hypothetical protein
MEIGSLRSNSDCSERQFGQWRFLPARDTVSETMKASLLYRISSIFLVLFAIGHTVGFSQIDPAWRVDSLVQSMKSVHFNVNGSDRTYWDFFFGFGLFVTVLMLFAAVVAWQLGSLSSETLATMRASTWGFAVSYALIAHLSWRYFFIIPTVFSVVIFVCLAAAAWLSRVEYRRIASHSR